MSVLKNDSPEREDILYVRIQEENKKFAKKEAKRTGFPDLATFIDALLTKLRETGTVTLKKK